MNTVIIVANYHATRSCAINCGEIVRVNQPLVAEVEVIIVCVNQPLVAEVEVIIVRVNKPLVAEVEVTISRQIVRTLSV